MKRKLHLLLFLIRILINFVGDFDMFFDWMETGFPDLGEVKMVRGSGSSSSNPRGDIDLNLPPQEESFPDPFPCTHLWDPEKIQKSLESKDRESLLQKKNAISGVVEEMVRREISEQGDSRSDCAIPNMKGFVDQVISECAHHFKSENLENKHKALSRLLTDLTKDYEGPGPKYKVREMIRKELRRAL